jgi:hypothetical protein
MYACCIRGNTSSTEWNSVVEFNFGIRGTEGIPDPSSHDWCEYIHQRSNRGLPIRLLRMMHPLLSVVEFLVGNPALCYSHGDNPEP